MGSSPSPSPPPTTTLATGSRDHARRDGGGMGSRARGDARALRYLARECGLAALLAAAHALRRPLDQAAQAADVVGGAYFRHGDASPEPPEDLLPADRSRPARNPDRPHPRLPLRPSDPRPLSQRAPLHDDPDPRRIAQGTEARLVAGPVLPGREALVDRGAGEGSGSLGAREAVG